jgi:hypothetical protein
MAADSRGEIGYNQGRPVLRVFLDSDNTHPIVESQQSNPPAI